MPERGKEWRKRPATPEEWGERLSHPGWVDLLASLHHDSWSPTEDVLRVLIDMPGDARQNAARMLEEMKLRDGIRELVDVPLSAEAEALRAAVDELNAEYALEHGCDA